MKSTSHPPCLFLKQPRKEDDVDVVDGGNTVIDGELQVLFKSIYIVYYLNLFCCPLPILYGSFAK